MEKKFFDFAFKCAEKSFQQDEVPIGAVIVKNGQVLAFSHNKKEFNHCVCDHAELLAIREAENKINNWRLDGCDIYVTLDPCPMCASAIKQARISNVYSALSNFDENSTKIIEQIFEKNDKTNKFVHFESNLCPNRSKKILNLFFEKKRNK